MLRVGLFAALLSSPGKENDPAMSSFDDVTSWPRPDPEPDGSRWGHSFRSGERVRLLSGPFENFAGVIDSVLGTKVRILIELFGSLTPVDVPFDEVEKL